MLVNAPAGYGKTTLITQWVERDGRPFAWLQLDRIHDDPVAFLTYLASALANVLDVDDQLIDLLAELVHQVSEERAALEGLIGRPLEPIAEVFRIAAGEARFWTLGDILKEREPEAARF